VRILNFERSGRPGIGLGVGGEWRGVDAEELGLPGGLDDLLLRNPEALPDLKSRLRHAPALEPGSFRFLPPLTRPGKIVCVGLNYAAHTQESAIKQPDYPTLFARFASSLLGHGEHIERPRESVQLDFEGELALVIGRGGRRIPRARALEHIAGWAPFNDASVRDFQFRTPQWTIGKNFDATGSFGPALVTPDELPSGARGLKLETRLNGRIVQSASTADMIFDVPTLIEVISVAMTLLPGDVIVTGTPEGVGFARTPPLWMQAGDRIEVEVEGVGLLANEVADA
jgi:acylpyruvate hydrolase